MYFSTRYPPMNVGVWSMAVVLFSVIEVSLFMVSWLDIVLIRGCPDNRVSWLESILLSWLEGFPNSEYLGYFFTSPSLLHFRSLKTVRQAVGGAPTPTALDGDGDSSSGETSSEEETENSTPSLATHSVRSTQVSLLPMVPISCQKAYNFELRDPSPADTALYERYE